MQRVSSDPAPLEGVLLYIEDTPLNVLLIQQWATLHPGLTLVVADTGLAGIEAFSRVAPDVVLLDVQLPDLDGLEVLARLRSLETYRGQPVAMLTATVVEEEQQAAFERGASAFWAKPIDFRSFVRDLRELLERSRMGDVPPASRLN